MVCQLSKHEVSRGPVCGVGVDAFLLSFPFFEKFKQKSHSQGVCTFPCSKAKKPKSGLELGTLSVGLAVPTFLLLTHLAWPSSRIYYPQKK